MALLSLVAAAAMLSPQTPTSIQAAWDYARDRDSYGMVVVQDSAVVLEEYLSGDAHTPHALASGSKSFLGPLVAGLVAEGVVGWDERLSDTLAEWRGDGRRDITVRQALSLTSGLRRMPAGLRVSVADALQLDLVAPPGTAFSYGPANYLVMTEFLTRKLRPRGETVESRLQRTILGPLGIQATFQPTTDGYPNLAGGGSASFSAWQTYGEMLLADGVHQGRPVVPAAELRECRRGSSANPGYGLTFWLPSANGVYLPGFAMPPSLPKDAFVAAGAGGQLLVVVPSRRMVIVRIGTLLARRPDGFDAGEFLAIAFGGEPQRSRAPGARRGR